MSSSIEHPSKESYPRRQHEIAGLDRIPAGADYHIENTEPRQGETPVVATVYVGAPDYNEQQFDPQSDPRQLQLIDLRGAPRNPDGAKIFNGEEWSEHADYLVIQPSSYSRDPKRGWKVLGNNGTFVFGRESKQSIGHFDMTSLVSRNHLRITSTPEGIVVTDLESSNGTAVQKYEQQPASHSPRPIGGKAVERVIPRPEQNGNHEFTDEEERVIAANIRLMLDDNDGGMANQMHGESMGGNAGHTVIDGKHYAQSASNGYVDTHGHIVEFANPQHASKYVLANKDKLIEICFVNAHPSFKIKNGQPVLDYPSSWARSNRVIDIYVDGKRIKVDDPIADSPLNSTARVLLESARRYNDTPNSR